MLSPAELPLFTRVLPLAIGAAVSPVVLVVQLLNLSSPRRALARSGAFLLGCTLVVLLWLLCAGWIASLLPVAQRGPDPIAAAFDAMFALVLSALGQRILQQPRPVEPRPAPAGVMAPALSGLALMGCNLSSLVLFLPAVQDITRAPLVGPAWWAAASSSAVGADHLVAGLASSSAGACAGCAGARRVGAIVVLGGAAAEGDQCLHLFRARAGAGAQSFSAGLIHGAGSLNQCLRVALHKGTSKNPNRM